LIGVRRAEPLRDPPRARQDARWIAAS